MEESGDKPTLVVDRDPEGLHNIVESSHILEASHVREVSGTEPAVCKSVTQFVCKFLPTSFNINNNSDFLNHVAPLKLFRFSPKTLFFFFTFNNKKNY